jgi:hypothetical protein
VEWTVPPNPPLSQEHAAPPRKFLSIWYRCCHTYGRLTRNKEGSAYEGRCPRCGAGVRARIGPGGTNRRMFEAR